MKKLMITGSFAGFLAGVAAGVVQGSSWASMVWRASVAAVAAGFLLRWWGQVWMNGLQSAYQEKLAAAEALELQQRAAQEKSK
jgi:hypothetical protein